MMDVVISSVVLEENMKDIARQPQPTVIIDCFNHSKAKEIHSSSRSHPRHKERDRPAESVKQETLEWMIVESPNCRRDDQPVMLRVDMAVQEFVLMHIAVHKVLPRVHDQHCN